MKNIQTILLQLFITTLTFSFSFAVPVSLSYFSAAVIVNDVSLEWGTSSEVNNSGFRIERKNTDSANWIEVGSVAGFGTTSEPHNYSFQDSGLPDGSYNYRLKQIDFNGNFEYFNLSQLIVINTSSVTYLSNLIDDNFRLNQNYPNPFNPATIIRYSLIENGFTSLKIFNSLGEEVATLVYQEQIAGTYEATFDGGDFPGGIYFYELRVKEFFETKKMTLLK